MISPLKTRLQKTFTKPFWINWLQATVYGFFGLSVFTLSEILLFSPGSTEAGSIATGMLYIGIGSLVGLSVLRQTFNRAWIYGSILAILVVGLIYLAVPAGTEQFAALLLFLIPFGAVLGPMIWKK